MIDAVTQGQNLQRSDDRIGPAPGYPVRMRRAVLTLALACFGVTLLQAAQAPAPEGDLPALLARVGEAVGRYYARAQSLMCIETVRLQTLGHDLLSDAGPGRRLEYELHVAWDEAAGGQTSEATINRHLIKVNGRPPQPKDEPQCTDPRDVSPEPLAMFLPDGQAELVFTIAGAAKVNGRAAVMLDFKSRTIGEARMTAKKDCLTFELPGRERGRVWIESETGEVLRLDTRLIGMSDFTLPHEQRRTGGPLFVTIERHDTSVIYKPVQFQEPEERLMLPASINTLSVIRNSGSPRLRTVQVFSNYQRFITGGRIVSTGSGGAQPTGDTDNAGPIP